ncbi:peptidase M48 [Nocardiopsis terrae]|uniref:Zn-dependent protease with chaperone function n=1 Tax=Nocardiopsis terrae TaxID=372655 RepID=A0ABR9HDG5_9ACTN|nr:M48 family metallopeptidase [Nocardiopsis terrae]MBE1457059.1 Zn-dependent protease with chaperone function [Nocardiopsis terrae]GHC90392.1 peptidase M48 [Nocardiopsis terrae]
MANSPDRVRVRLTDISPRAYEHPADRGALVALRSLTGFDTLVKSLFGRINERSLRLMFLSSAVRVSPTQFPELHDYLRDAAYVLDLDEVPELYVKMDPQPNAMAIGRKKPFIVMTTGLFDLFNAEEKRFVIGHEVGHVLSGHAVYRTILLLLVWLSTKIMWIPLGAIAIQAILAGLREWQRKSELSSDRAGLLTCQNPEAAKRALMKLAGGSNLSQMNPDAFMEQAREYESGGDAVDSVLKLMTTVPQSHPFAVVRVAELHRWVESGDYQRIVDGEYPRRATDRDASVSEETANAARSYREGWNRSSDPLVKTIRDVAGGAGRAGGQFFDTVADRWRGGQGGGTESDRNGGGGNDSSGGGNSN